MLTVLLQPVAAWASFGPIQTRVKDWCFALLLLEGAMLGAFLSLDLFLFYVFWELMLVPMYVMIGVWGGANRIKSAVKFFLYTMFGSVLMLAAILYIAYAYARVSPDEMPSFDYFELQRLMLPRQRADLALRRVRAVVLHQGPDVAGPHVAPRRAHRGPHRRARSSWPRSC